MSVLIVPTAGVQLYGETVNWHLAARRSVIFARVFAFVQGSHSGAPGSFAVVRRANDESLIESGPQRSDLPDLTQNLIQFSYFMNICCSPSLCCHSFRTCLTGSLSGRRVIGRGLERTVDVGPPSKTALENPLCLS